MRIGTITNASNPIKVTDDLDSTTAMPVDVYAPAAAPAVNDRVLYDVVGGLVVVVANITSPVRMWTTLISQGGTANVVDSQALTFPTGWFTSTPKVVGTLGTGNSAPATVNTEYWANNITTAGFTANMIRSNATACTMRWIAVQA